MWPFTRKEERAESSVHVLEAAFAESAASREMALQIPAVQGCIGRIAETVARLPIRLYRRDGENVQEIRDDRRLRLLNDDTGDTLNAADFWKAMLEDYYLGQGGYAYLKRWGLDIASIHYVSSHHLSVIKNNDPVFKAFDVIVNGRRYMYYDFLRILRRTKDGCTNIPLQEQAPLIFAVVYNSLRFEDSMVRKGGNKRGFLKAKNKVRDPDELRQKWNQLYANDSENVMVLNEGMEFQEASNTSVEMQLNENKQTNSREICKLIGVPPNILEGNASEEDKKTFTATVMSVLCDIETALDRDLLLESEKGTLYWAFDTRELTRGSIKERFEAYEIASRNNILQPDEIRREEDLPPTGFNYFRLGLQDVLLDLKNNTVYTPNTNCFVQLGKQRSMDKPKESEESYEHRDPGG